ncbi:MAG: hypothetical protein IPK68_21735 [Bdellovibrionales bacterium]|nr:hypothetical protein [Bdellovibrionales bacterium]
MGKFPKILVLVLTVGLSASGRSQGALEISDQFFSWSPKVFKIKSEVMSASLDELEANRDSSTKETFSSYSDFKSDYIRFFTNGYISHLANKFEPGSLESSYKNDGVEALFYQIKGIGGWLLEDAFNGTYPWRGYDREVKYGYCEANPGSTESICEEGVYTPFYALIVRSISTESFIKNACGPFTDVVVWRFGWNLVSPSPRAPKKDEFLQSLDNLLGALDYLKKSETWDVSEAFMKKLDQFSLPGEVKHALRKRYYDRGPNLMANLADCAARAKQKITDATSHVVPDSVMTEKMDSVFGFREFRLPYDVTDVKNPFSDSMISSDFSTNENLYRLFRQLPDSYPVVIDLNFQGARLGSYDDEIVIKSGNMPQLLNFVNLIDQRFHYQIMTDKDVEKGIYQYNYNPRYEFGGLGNHFCVLNQEEELISITVDPDNGSVSSKRVNACSTDRYLIERRLKQSIR